VITPAFDFTKPGFWADPNEFFAILREEAPIFELPDDGGYLVCRYEDVRSAAARTEVYSSIRPVFGAGDPELEAIQATGFPIVPTMSNNDPPKHTRFRKLVNRAFAPKVVQALEVSIRQIASSLIDDLDGRTTMNFCREFADVIPSYVIADWLGVPRGDQPKFKAWADDMVETTLSPSIGRQRQLECKRSYVDFQHYFARIIEERRGSPSEDAVSLLVNAQVDDERPLDVPEILDLLRQFLIAGNDTTANLLAGAMLLLVDHPSTFSEVRNDRGLIPLMVEESLRIVSPAQWTMRTVMAGDEMSGCPVKPGPRARIVLASANRDKKRFEDPNRFDIHRDASGHVAFGHGMHYCIGHLLARAEARIAFEVLFDRLSDIELAIPRDQVRRKEVPGVYQLAGLPLRFRHKAQAG
jgi:cytochrome P450